MNPILSILKGVYQKGAPLIKGAAGYNAFDQLQKGNPLATAASLAASAPGRTLGALRAAPAMLSGAAAPMIGGTAALFGLSEGLAPRSVNSGTLEGRMTPAEKKAFDAETRARQLAEKDRADAEDTLRGGGRNYIPPLEPEQPSNTQLPPSAEEMMMDPYAYNLAVYGQGRNMAGSQQQMDAVRDLGIAINKQLFPQFDNTRVMTPVEQRVAPDLTPYSIQGTIKEKGVNQPASMMEADEVAELTAAENADNPYQVEARTRAVEQLLEQAQVDALRRRFGVV